MTGTAAFYLRPRRSFGETFPLLGALIGVTEETFKTCDSDKQTLGEATLSVKSAASDQQLLQDILELAARNELSEAHRRVHEHFQRN